LPHGSRETKIIADDAIIRRRAAAKPTARRHVADRISKPEGRRRNKSVPAAV